MARERWELLLIDNRSDRPLANVYDLSWHPLARDMREEELGLTPDRNAEPESKRRMGRSEKNVFWRTRHKLKDKCRALKREFLLRKRRLGEFGVRLHLLPRRVKHIYGPAQGGYRPEASRKMAMFTTSENSHAQSSLIVENSHRFGT